MKIKNLLILSLAFLAACKSSVPLETEPITIKGKFANNFYLGTALSLKQINELDSIQSALIAREFNAYTAENVMKSMHIHPSKDTFNFAASDRLFDLAKKNNAVVHGHNLLWHSQLSKFFEEIKDSTEMVAALTNHIYTIAGRYKGRTLSWDVVNEAVEGDGSLRKSVFLEVMGAGYLPIVFKLAAAVDPKADLYYNDYSMTVPVKKAGVIEMVKNIQAAGAKIDGIGMQGHWHLDSPTIEEIETSILAYSALGLKVAITELDIDVLPRPKNVEGADISQKAEIDILNNPYTAGLPESLVAAQTQRYKDIFELFLKHQDKISRVTFWGVNDGDSWKNNFPAKSRTNYPLLFDRNNKPKLAYDAILSLKD